jgi:hypothetical protein
MTPKDFRHLLLEKWGKSYDVQLRRRHHRVVLLVMWKYLEQPSFPWSEQDYLEHLQRVLAHLHEWGVIEAVQEAILATRQKPRLGQAVTISLSLTDLGERASEWIL